MGPDMRSYLNFLFIVTLPIFLNSCGDDKLFHKAVDDESELLGGKTPPPIPIPAIRIGNPGINIYGARFKSEIMLLQIESLEILNLTNNDIAKSQTKLGFLGLSWGLFTI